MVERKKSSVYLDPSILRAVRVRAAREDKPDYLVIEDALRRYLKMDILERLRSRGPGMAEEDAMKLAVQESKRVRRTQGKQTQGKQTQGKQTKA